MDGGHIVGLGQVKAADSEQRRNMFGRQLDNAESDWIAYAITLTSSENPVERSRIRPSVIGLPPASSR
jgi:hypothetical protein